METQNKKFLRYKSSIKLSPIEMSIKTAWLTSSQLNQRKTKKKNKKQDARVDWNKPYYSICDAEIDRLLGFVYWVPSILMKIEEKPPWSTHLHLPLLSRLFYLLFNFFYFSLIAFDWFYFYYVIDLLIFASVLIRFGDWSPGGDTENWVPQRMDQSLWEPHCPPNSYHLRYPKFWFESDPFVIY